MLYSALIFGLASSLHCVGMCGPIAMMLPVDRKSETKRVLQTLLYHIGRLTAYASLGLLFGLLGKGLYLAGLQQQISIAMGFFMIAIVLIPEKLFAKYNFSKPVHKILSKLKSKLGQQFKHKTWDTYFTIGLLNGFLPCGLVYAALFGAIAMQSPYLGSLYMVFYGLGTVPMMSFVILLSNFITTSVRNKTQKIILPIITCVIGFLFILRGLGLGIPYISPNNMTLFVKSIPSCH
jgi:sulfite exporter TauE/SafE